MYSKAIAVWLKRNEVMVNTQDMMIMVRKMVAIVRYWVSYYYVAKVVSNLFDGLNKVLLTAGV